jgi:hypothetical protein
MEEPFQVFGRIAPAHRLAERHDVAGRGLVQRGMERIAVAVGLPVLLQLLAREPVEPVAEGGPRSSTK